MNFKSICSDISTGARAIAFGMKKHSPEIFTGAAIIFGVGAVVATWIAARKTDKALEEPKTIIKTAKSMEIDEKYTKEDQKHDILLGYRKGAVEMIKLYGPAALMGATSIACVLMSHRILSNRNAGLIAANSILSKEFSDYRDKVIEKYGKEEDHLLRFGDKMQLVEKTTTDENGNETTVVTEKPKDDYADLTFARCFDEICPAFQKDTYYNLDFIKRKQSELNDKLKAQRVLTLNEVYEVFGFEKTQAGFYYGWVYDPRDEFKVLVDFGLPFEDREWLHRVVCEGQRSFWLDFNCKEIIWSKTPFRKG